MLDDIKSVEFDHDTETMTVSYQGGTVVDYRPIHWTLFSGIVSANDLSSAVHQVIRSGAVVGTTRPKHG